MHLVSMFFGDGFCKRFNTTLPEASATRTIGTFRRASVQRELNVIHRNTPGMVLVGGFWQMMRLKNKMVKCIKIKSLLNTAKIKFTSDERTNASLFLSLYLCPPIERRTSTIITAMIRLIIEHAFNADLSIRLLDGHIIPGTHNRNNLPQELR